MLIVNTSTMKLIPEDEFRKIKLSSETPILFPSVLTAEHLMDVDEFEPVTEPNKPMIKPYQDAYLSEPYYDENGKLRVKWVVVNKPLTDNLRNSLIKQLQEVFETYIGEIKKNYPDSEVSSWYKQEQEARAYLIDPNAHIPLINSLSKYRKLDKDFLANKIVEKADLFAVEVGKLIGARQKLEDQILSAVNVDQLPEIPQSLNHE